MEVHSPSSRVLYTGALNTVHALMEKHRYKMISAITARRQTRMVCVFALCWPIGKFLKFSAADADVSTKC